MARIPEFYKLSVSQRVREVRKKGLLSNQDYQALVSGDHTLSIQSADKMIENVIGVMGLPVGLGLNFLINGKEYAIPLVVEEPSIVAALSSAAKIARAGGGSPIVLPPTRVRALASALITALAETLRGSHLELLAFLVTLALTSPAPALQPIPGRTRTPLVADRFSD